MATPRRRPPASGTAPRARPPSGAAWSRRTEDLSLALPDALLREARANTRRVARDVVFLERLAREVALTRGAELTLAYRNLVWVMPGFRKKRSSRGARVTSELCVVFVVRRKGSVLPGDQQQLPRWLVTFAEHGGQRLPFALPTDVRDATDFNRARAHADSGLWVKNGDWAGADGSMACLVRLRHDGGEQTCILSARHVLTPFGDSGAPLLAGGLPVLPLDAQGNQSIAPPLGVGLPVGGRLRGDQRADRPSFDVQLAAADGNNSVAPRLALRRLNTALPWVRTRADLLALDQRGWFYLLPPDNHPRAPGRGPIKMTVSTMPANAVGIEYPFADDAGLVERTVYHTELLHFDAVNLAAADPVPLGGDSGSPIVARHADGSMTLVAMHIAGDEQGLSWAIPAWALFNLDNWAQYPSGASIEPVEP